MCRYADITKAAEENKDNQLQPKIGELESFQQMKNSMKRCLIPAPLIRAKNYYRVAFINKLKENGDAPPFT